MLWGPCGEASFDDFENMIGESEKNTSVLETSIVPIQILLTTLNNK